MLQAIDLTYTQRERATEDMYCFDGLGAIRITRFHLGINCIWSWEFIMRSE